MFLHPFDNIWLWTYVHRHFDAQSGPIEKKPVCGVWKQKCLKPIDFSEYVAKYITKKQKHNIF